MQVKKFEGLTMQAAMKSVKEQFGMEAVILKTETRQIGENGVTTNVYEVTAASVDAPRSLGGSAHDLGREIGFARLDAGIGRVETRLKDFEDQNSASLRFDRLESGLREIKLFLRDVVSSRDERKHINVPEAAELMVQLEVMGIDPNLIDHLGVELLKLREQIKVDGVKINGPDPFRAAVIRWLMRPIHVTRPWDDSVDTRKVHVFMGSSGSGKTSFVAKLASFLARQRNKKSVIISYDPEKLTSSSQAKLLARIIGTPFDEISSVKELNQSVKKYRDKDFILVDFAGRNAKLNLPDDYRELAALPFNIAKHLVLSTAEKTVQLEKSVQRFAEVGISSSIFSKLDESWSYGDMFNVSARWQIPISAFSVSQDIVQGLEFASRERVVERILGE